MAVRLWHRTRSDVDESQSVRAAVIDMGPMCTDSSVVLEALYDDEVFARRVIIGQRLGSNVEGQRFFASAGEFEIDVRRQCESRTFVDIVGFGIDRNVAGSSAGIKDLTFPFLCSSAGDCAGVKRGIADGRDIDE